jgi:hypothetical protein
MEAGFIPIATTRILRVGSLRHGIAEDASNRQGDER